MKMNIRLVTLVGSLVLVGTAVAEQAGAGHYVSGQQADFSTMPPTTPGWAFANYFLNYNNATFDAAKGLPFGRDIALKVTANQTAEVPTVIYTYPVDFLGGNLSSGVCVPFVWVRIKAEGKIVGGVPDFSKTISQSTSGLGDIEFMPVMAAWTNGDFKLGGQFNFWAPTGDYNKDNLANTGLGYWTFEPMVAFSWLSSKIGTEVTVFSAVDFNTENTDANYQSGNIFHVDGTVAQHFPLFDGFAGVGATAFWLKQISDDSGSGSKLGGFQAQSYGVGPTVSYVHPIGKSTFIFDASWLPQTHSDNTTKGDLLWIKAALAF